MYKLIYWLIVDNHPCSSPHENLHFSWYRASLKTALKALTIFSVWAFPSILVPLICHARKHGTYALCTVTTVRTPLVFSVHTSWFGGSELLIAIEVIKSTSWGRKISSNLSHSPNSSFLSSLNFNVIDCRHYA